METANEIWSGIVWFFTSPQTSSFAMLFCAITTFGFSHQLVTGLVNDYWPQSAERRGVGLIRATVNLSLIAGLTLASVGIVMAMRQP